MGERFEEIAERMAKERHRHISVARETLSSASLKLLITLLPTPDDLRRYSTYVNVEEMKKIEDPRELSSRLQEVEQALRLMAGTLEVFYDNKEETESRIP